jgi:hypothetical protein
VDGGEIIVVVECSGGGVVGITFFLAPQRRDQSECGGDVAHIP